MEEIEWSRLSEASRLFAMELFEAEPSLEACAGMIKSGNSEEFDLLVRIDSPTGDSERAIHLWMDGGDEPSIEFGSWHTHSSLERDETRSIIQIVQAIQKDQLVIFHDPKGIGFGKNRVIDLREKTALAEALTGSFVSDYGQIKSWTGLIDRNVSLSGMA